MDAGVGAGPSLALRPRLRWRAPLPGGDGATARRTSRLLPRWRLVAGRRCARLARPLRPWA
eukprot:6540332-Alexandrium_andersonii.AAC.1